MTSETISSADSRTPAQDQEKELSAKRLENFKIALSRRGEAERLTIDKMIAEFTIDLPPKLQKEVIAAFERFKRKGITGDDLKEEVIEVRRLLKLAYEDTRFDMENKPYSKLQAMKRIDELFEKKDVNMESLKQVARISFDLNGLKAVNDLTGSHEKGDLYLRMMIDVLKSDEATAWLTERNMEAVITVDGGDEFGIVLKSDKAIDTKEVFNDFIGKIVKKKLWESPLAKEVLDFNSEEVLVAFAGIDKRNWELKTAVEKKNILDEIKQGIPEGYFFRAAVSAGVTTLYESIAYAKIDASDSYEKILGKAMGSLFDASDKEMQIDKVDFKANLAKSKDLHENFLLKVYSRTENEKELRAIIEVYEIFLKNLEQAIAEDATSVLPKLISEVKAKIEELKKRAQEIKK